MERGRRRRQTPLRRYSSHLQSQNSIRARQRNQATGKFHYLETARIETTFSPTLRDSRSLFFSPRFFFPPSTYIYLSSLSKNALNLYTRLYLYLHSQTTSFEGNSNVLLPSSFFVSFTFLFSPRFYLNVKLLTTQQISFVYV